MAYTRLGDSSATFGGMMKDGFGIVTVMNASVYDALSTEEYAAQTPEEIIAAAKDPICTLDTLKVANVTMEGPSKTVTGGRYSNPLIKFGKSARLEMQDALGNGNAIDALCGGVAEYASLTNDKTVDRTSAISALHFGEDFCGPKMIIGETFFIDRKTGQQVKVNIVFYQFLPDSIFNLTQDAEGDATVFDMNGDLLTTEVLLPTDAEGVTAPHGVFYSIVPVSSK